MNHLGGDSRNLPDVRTSGGLYAFTMATQADRLRVLLVDDEIVVRDAIARFMRSRGTDVVVAGTAIVALTVLQLHAIDVLVSGIEMPRRDGFWLIRAVRSIPALRAIPAIAFTSVARDDSQRILDAGFSAYVENANPHRLWVTIQSLQPRLAG